MPGLPPFAGGAVGVFAYDLVRTVEPLGEPNPDPVGVPDLALMLTDALVVFDHLKRTVTVIANVYADDDDLEASYAQAVETIAEVRWRLAARFRARRRPTPARPRRRPSSSPTCRASSSRRWSRGSSNTSTPATRSRWCRRSAGRRRCRSQAFSIYRGLRAVNPSPYMYFLDFGDFEIAGASPEPLITVTGRRVATRPIAGTRPRGADRRTRTGGWPTSCWPTRRSAPST